MARSRPWKDLGKAAVGLASAGAWPVHAQTLGLAPSHDVSPWRVVGALLFCCLLGAVGAVALRYRLHGKPPMVGKSYTSPWLQLIAGFSPRAKPVGTGAERLKLVETIRLGHQVEVNLLDCDGRRLVVLTSPQGPLVVHPEAPDDSGKSS